MTATSATEKDHGYKPSAVRDCSTYQFCYVADDLQVTSLSELEFQQ